MYKNRKRQETQAEIVQAHLKIISTCTDDPAERETKQNKKWADSIKV